MKMRLGDDALPGKGQQRREQDKPAGPGPHAGRALSPRAAFSMDRPAIGQSRAFGFIIGQRPGFWARDMLHYIGNQPHPTVNQALRLNCVSFCRA
jgi:hypothetical protein